MNHAAAALAGALLTYGATLATPLPQASGDGATSVSVRRGGDPVAGAEVFGLTGPFPGVAPLVATRRVRARTGPDGAARLQLAPGLFWSVWASWRSGGRQWASRLAEGVRPGRALKLRLLPFGKDRFKFRGIAPWRRLLGGGIRARFVARGRLAPTFETPFVGTAVRMPPLPYGPFIAAVTDGGRPADWASRAATERTLRLAKPVAFQASDYATPKGGRRVFLVYGSSFANLLHELGPDEHGVWLSSRESIYEHRLELRALDPIDERGVCLVRGPRPGAGIEIVEKRTRKPLAWLATIVDGAAKPRADERVWVAVGRGLAPYRTDARGRIVAYGRSELFVVERGRGVRIGPSARKPGFGASFTIDLSERVPVELRTVGLDGRPRPGAVCSIDGLAVGPTDEHGVARLRLMPGVHVVNGGPDGGRQVKPLVLRHPTDGCFHEGNKRTSKVPSTRVFEVPVWRMIDVRGTVRDGGRPVAGAGLRIRGFATNGRPGAAIWYGETDAKGAFRFRVPDHPLPSSIEIRYRKDGELVVKGTEIDVTAAAAAIELSELPHGLPVDASARRAMGDGVKKGK